MKIIDKAKEGAQFLTIECLMILYALRDPTVPRRVKPLLFLPLIYIISPIDLIPDAFFLVGNLDDIAVVKLTHFLFRHLTPRDILLENRSKAERFLMGGMQPRMKFVLIIAVIWVSLITFLCIYLLRKYLKRHQ